MGDPEGEPDEAVRPAEVAPFRLMRLEGLETAFVAAGIAYISETGSVPEAWFRSHV